eukprot:366254-Chlamydomonas_euryale.AAC.3
MGINSGIFWVDPGSCRDYPSLSCALSSPGCGTAALATPPIASQCSPTAPDDCHPDAAAAHNTKEVATAAAPGRTLQRSRGADGDAHACGARGETPSLQLARHAAALDATRQPDAMRRGRTDVGGGRSTSLPPCRIPAPNRGAQPVSSRRIVTHLLPASPTLTLEGRWRRCGGGGGGDGGATVAAVAAAAAPKAGCSYADSAIACLDAARTARVRRSRDVSSAAASAAISDPADVVPSPYGEDDDDDEEGRPGM